MALTVALGFTQQAHAASIAGSMSEPFDYTAQNVPNASTLNGGQGFNATGTATANDATANWGIAGTTLNSGTARNITTPGLAATATGYLAASGNKLTMDSSTGTVNNNIGRILGQTIDSGTTFFSMQLRKNNDTLRTINVAFLGGTTQAAGGTERFAVAQVGATAGNSNGNIALLMNNTNPGGIVNSANPIAMGVGITHLIVGRIDWNGAGFETVSIWVDPTDVTTQAAAGTVYASTAAFELAGFNAIRPFVGNSATVAGGTVPGASADFDEIRLGGSWESVTSLPVAVPEPASALLFALSGLALGAFRKRS